MLKKDLGGEKEKMKTMGFFAIAIMIAMVGFFSVAIADEKTQDVNVTVDEAVPGLEVTPPEYGYGSVTQGQCSNENPHVTVGNPSGTIQLNSTGNIDITVTTVAAGIFAGIDYCIGSTPCTPWTDVNTFSVVVPFGTVQEVNTRICVSSEYLGLYENMVTFEYISAP